jgi:hypothetical protein
MPRSKMSDGRFPRSAQAPTSLASMPANMPCTLPKRSETTHVVDYRSSGAGCSNATARKYISQCAIQKHNRVQQNEMNKLVQIHRHGLYNRMAHGCDCCASNHTTAKPVASPEALKIALAAHHHCGGARRKGDSASAA